MGWSLGGLSAVTRCPKTVAQDGAKDGINPNTTDRLCMDGQRLVAIPTATNTDSSYWVAGTEYRTEIEIFTRIKLMSDGTCAQWFQVWTKSGQIMEFGHRADSCIKAQSNSALLMVWPVSKIADAVAQEVRFPSVTALQAQKGWLPPPLPAHAMCAFAQTSKTLCSNLSH
jgi:hypothetical protein